MKALLSLAVLPAAAACATAANLLENPAPSAGEIAFQKCFSCHAIEAGKHDLAGPSLHGIVGRKVAAVAGFDYSPAMKRFAVANPVWTRTLLDRLAADPEALVPGTSMAFHGMADDAERADLIDYLERHGSQGVVSRTGSQEK